MNHLPVSRSISRCEGMDLCVPERACTHIHVYAHYTHTPCTHARNTQTAMHTRMHARHALIHAYYSHTNTHKHASMHA